MNEKEYSSPTISQVGGSEVQPDCVFGAVVIAIAVAGAGIYAGAAVGQMALYLNAYATDNIGC